MLELKGKVEGIDAQTKRIVVETLVKEIVVQRPKDGELSLQATYRFESPMQIANNAC